MTVWPATMFERVHVVLYRRVRPGFDPQPQPGKKQQIKATLPQLLEARLLTVFGDVKPRTDRVCSLSRLSRSRGGLEIRK